MTETSLLELLDESESEINTVKQFINNMGIYNVLKTRRMIILMRKGGYEKLLVKEDV